MSRKREHGRIISVETHARGDALAEDAAAGATSITVEDAGDFDEDGGWLTIGGQVIEFSECDDDTGVILLVDPLTAAAEQGDPVQVWSDLYDEVIEYQQALVELDGEYDNPDPVVAEVAEGVGELPEGDRGKAGESCTLLRVADDEWEVVGVGGRSRKSQGILFHQDAHTVTATGSQSVALTYTPIENSEHLYWNGLYQPGSEWTRDGQTIAVPDAGAFIKVDDELVVEYAYRKGVITSPAHPEPGTLDVHGSDSYYGGLQTSIALPAGTQVGDLIVISAVGVSTTDARFTNYGPGTWNVYVGTASSLDAIPVTTLTTCCWTIVAFTPLAVTSHTVENYPSDACPVVTGNKAILAVNESSSFAQFTVAPPVPAGYVTVDDSSKTASGANSGGFQMTSILMWSDAAATSSPAGTITYGSGREGGVAVAIGVA